MTTRSCLDKLHRSGALLTMAAALVMSTVAASPASAQSNAVTTTQEGRYSLWDISPFFGSQYFQLYQGSSARPLDFRAGIMVGGRVTENVSRYFSLEQGFSAAWNQAQFLPTGFPEGVRATLSSRNYQLSALAVLHLTPRDKLIRPFFVVGPAATWFNPAPASDMNTNGATAPFSAKTSLEPGLIYGVGLKSELTRHIGVRIDLRGLWGEQPHFGITASPGAVGSIYVPSHGTVSALQFTTGIVFHFDYHEPPPPPAPAPPPPPPPVAHVQVGAITGAQNVCPGDNLRLQVSASGWLPDQTPSYQWTVNGQPASGANGSTFMVPTAGGSGSLSIGVTVSAGGSSATASPVTVQIRALAPPTIRFAVSPTTIAYGDKLPLNATATGSDCGGPATVRYTASEGSISGNTYDSSGVSFDMNNRLQQQSKTITLTATATDQKNQTARATANVTVTLTPQAKRLDDIVFANNSARVNNCGKRLLLEELTPMLRNDPNAKVILIGHRDNGERVALRLDENRTLNAAAILSAGTGICPSLDLSRILVHYAGTDQSSDTRPALCGSSVTERSGQAIRDTDRRAQFRRVEIWIVPGGAEMPAGTAGYTPAPERETKAKACPR
jgi:hypothetical protein